MYPSANLHKLFMEKDGNQYLNVLLRIDVLQWLREEKDHHCPNMEGRLFRHFGPLHCNFRKSHANNYAYIVVKSVAKLHTGLTKWSCTEIEPLILKSKLSHLKYIKARQIGRAM